MLHLYLVCQILHITLEGAGLLWSWGPKLEALFGAVGYFG
jgi:hypothetical protein